MYRGGLTEASPIVQWLWDALEAFEPADRSAYLRFVAGRSRLPTDPRWSRHDPDDDMRLPEARTCFFALVLPSYASSEILRERLLYAIHYCRRHDADFAVADARPHERLANPRAASELYALRRRRDGGVLV